MTWPKPRLCVTVEPDVTGLLGVTPFGQHHAAVFIKCICEHPGPATPIASAHKCLSGMQMSAHHTSPGIKWCSVYSRPLTPFQIYCIYLKTTNILNYFHTAQDHNLLRGMSYQVSQGLLQNVRSKG